MDRSKWEHLVAELVERMQCGEISQLEKLDDWISEDHAGGAVIFRKRFPTAKAFAFRGRYTFYATDPRYHARLEAWNIVSPETFESGKWEYPVSEGIDWNLESFASYFTIGGFERIEMFEDGSFIAFVKEPGGNPIYDEFKIAADSEYAKYIESKVGKMEPGDIIVFADNPLWKTGKNNKDSGEPCLPTKIRAEDRL